MCRIFIGPNVATKQILISCGQTLAPVSKFSFLPIT
jgi:hypothetical protein